MTFFKNTFIFLLTSFCMFLLMEFYFTQSEMMQPISGSVDSKIGFSFIDEQDFVMFNEGFCIGRTNSHGYSGENVPKKRITNTFRIAVLGDSYTQATQLFERSHFVTKLQNRLNQYIDTEVEVLNFGVAGYNLSDMYCYSKNRVQDFNPDLMLFVISESDFQERSNHQKKKKLHPFVEIQKNSLRINYNFTENIKYKIYEKATLFFNLSFGRLLNKIYINIQSNRTTSIFFDKFHTFFKKKKQSKVKRKQEQVITKVSRLILQELKKQNAIIVYRDTINQNSMDFIENEIGLQTINLNDTLNIMKRNHIDPNYWKVTKRRGHWNHDGHKAVGLFLAKKIKQMNIKF